MVSYWKKIVDSKDLIVFEKTKDGQKIRIEARMNSDKVWEVFESNITQDKSTLVNEYTLNTKEEVLQLVDLLKKNTPTKMMYKKLNRKRYNISLKRIYKEEFIEKWHFYLNKDKIENMLLIKYDTEAKIDILLHERYKDIENQIIKQIETKLGLMDLSESLSYSIYYYRNKQNRWKETDQEQGNVLLGSFEVRFDDEF